MPIHAIPHRHRHGLFEISNVCRMACVLFVILLLGCRSMERSPAIPSPAMAPPPIPLECGDMLQITFPGAPNLNTSQKINSDGSINLQMVGSITAAGRTLHEFQTDIAQRYGPQLQNKEVVVTVLSSSAAVYVIGAVFKPGKIPIERKLTVLEAIMEAGGFDPKKADLKKVMIVHQSGGAGTHTEMIDLSPLLRGASVTPALLQARDIVIVPEKTQWF
jgi:polysaccharide biosynthesis/export protein